MSRIGGGTHATLSADELAACRPVGQGRRGRAFCPFHGSDHQRSLAVDRETGHFHCFACGAWGYLAEARAARQSPTARVPRPPGPRDPAVPAPRPDLATHLTRWQAAWTSRAGQTWGIPYLAARGMPLALVHRLGVGYAPPGGWPGAYASAGHLVFPHHRPTGALVNLYARAVENPAHPAHRRHDHRPGPKGLFHARALLTEAGPLAVCEGVFDALTLLALGHERTVALFGLSGWRWEVVPRGVPVVVAFDADAPGQAGARAFARAARFRGHPVSVVPPAAYGPTKDLNAAWTAGTLDGSQLRAAGLTVGPAPASVASHARNEEPIP